MSVQGILVIIVLVVLFALAVVWISRNGGWQNEGCHGNCAECHKKCEEPEQKNPPRP
ncbi:MAG: FeoB-associated Cys-rich membrane protein [Faecalibacterium sp.]|jgi:hypothetical protein|nr:FeoB-associated Cys-rich membrane protein [Faecalibacterium sp.]